MSIFFFIHLFLIQLLPSNSALSPLDTEGYCLLSEGSSQDKDVFYIADIFADDENHDEDNNKVSNPLDPTYYSPNLTFSSSFDDTKTTSVFFNSTSFPKQKLFLLYNQLKLDC